MGKTLQEMQREFANSIVDQALEETEKIMNERLDREERMKEIARSKITKGTHANLIEQENRKRKNVRHMGSKYR